jgi:molecular chaperone DnaJ
MAAGAFPLVEKARAAKMSLGVEMPRDYYLVLGIARTASPEDIKQAYRQIAKRLHPDKSRSKETTERFLEARNAYDTLSDVDKRRAYDAALADQARPRAARPVRKSGGPMADGFAPRGGRNSSDSEILKAFFPGVFQREETRSQEDPYIEILLSPQEAERGGCYPVTLQMPGPCRHCGGTGASTFFDCPVCRGRGRVSSRQTFDLSLPPGIRDGTTATLSLAGVGIAGTRLHVRVRVAPSPSEF